MVAFVQVVFPDRYSMTGVVQIAFETLVSYFSCQASRNKSQTQQQTWSQPQSQPQSQSQSQTQTQFRSRAGGEAKKKIGNAEDKMGEC